MSSLDTDHANFHASAHAQEHSLFFTLLPAEIRDLIYIEFWRASSRTGTLRQHVFRRPDLEQTPGAPRSSHWAHAPCVTNPAGDDVRYTGFRNANPGSLERASWLQRLKTEWCLHWACEEADFAMLAESGDSVPQRSLFMPVLTTCKRMYIEALPSLYTHTTFIFTDIPCADEFISLYTLSQTNLRSLEFSIRASNLLTELYFPYDELADPSSDGPILTGSARLSMSNNPWARVCDLLAQQQSLQSLRVWFDTRDLRPWHKRVSETRLFGRLFDVKIANRDKFVLALPELPERNWEEDTEYFPHGLAAHHFLEGKVTENAPFKVIRGPRPNNWRVHMGDRFGERFLVGLGAG
ncbi:hypothetical protein OQA88_2898 [Cercophora sp. LCS_1]